MKTQLIFLSYVKATTNKIGRLLKKMQYKCERNLGGEIKENHSGKIPEDYRKKHRLLNKPDDPLRPCSSSTNVTK